MDWIKNFFVFSALFCYAFFDNSDFHCSYWEKGWYLLLDGALWPKVETIFPWRIRSEMMMNWNRIKHWPHFLEKAKWNFEMYANWETQLFSMISIEFQQKLTRSQVGHSENHNLTKNTIWMKCREKQEMPEKKPHFICSLLAIIWPLVYADPYWIWVWFDDTAVFDVGAVFDVCWLSSGLLWCADDASPTFVVHVDSVNL